MEEKEGCEKVLSVLRNGSRPLLEMSIVRQNFPKLFKELAKRFLPPSIKEASLYSIESIDVQGLRKTLNLLI